MAKPTLEEYKQLRRQGLTPQEALAGKKTLPSYQENKPTGIIQSVAQGIVSPFAKTASTALSAGRGIVNLARAAALPGRITKNPEAMKLVGQAGEPVNLNLGYLGNYKPIEKTKEALGVGLELGSMIAPGLNTVKGISKAAIATRIGVGGLSGAGMAGGASMSAGQGIKENIKSAVVGGAVGLLAAGALEGLGAVWRSIGQRKTIQRITGTTYQKELQPPVKEVARDLEKGFKTFGEQVAGVVDDKGNPVYVAKVRGLTQGKGGGYDQLLNTAKNEIKTNGSKLDVGLAQSKEIINKSEVAGNVVKQMEDRYGSLTPQQIKQITFEVNRMPEKMNLTGVESLKRMYDDLIPDSFWAKLDDPAQAFPSLVKYTLRDNARQIINEKAPNVAVRELNNRMSIAMDVKKLAAMQLAKRMQFKGAQTGSGFFITRYISKAIDDYLLNPIITTQISQGIRRMGQKTGQTALRQAGRVLTTKFGEKLTK